MTLDAATKAERRAIRALSHALKSLGNATTARAQARHERRASVARVQLQDARRIGSALSCER